MGLDSGLKGDGFFLIAVDLVRMSNKYGFTFASTSENQHENSILHALSSDSRDLNTPQLDEQVSVLTVVDKLIRQQIVEVLESVKFRIELLDLMGAI